MKNFTLSLLLAIFFTATAFAQTATTGTTPAANGNSASSASAAIPAPPAINANSTPVELARAALAAQGGDKFKNVKNIWIHGEVNLYSPNSSFPQPGKFSLVTAGAKMRLDVDSPVIKFKQIFDGQQSYSSMPGVQTPPADKFGLFVLTKYDQSGYTVSALANEKKLRGFRIVDPEGNTTDFYIDPVNARVIKYVSPYMGYTFGTENSKFKEIDGILIPFNFTQRLEMSMGAFFADYKVKEAKINQPLNDDVFVIQ
jgi:hypothetical protein